MYGCEERILLEGAVCRLVEGASNSNTEESILWKDTCCGVRQLFSIHTNLEVEQVFQEAGCLVRYLPPYSPDFNPIELTFNILKAWMRKNWASQRKNFTNLDDFLWYALEHSKCDSFAKEQFRHAADGVYCEGNNVREFYRWIERWELEVSGEVNAEGQASG